MSTNVLSLSVPSHIMFPSTFYSDNFTGFHQNSCSEAAACLQTQHIQLKQKKSPFAHPAPYSMGIRVNNILISCLKLWEMPVCYTCPSQLLCILKYTYPRAHTMMPNQPTSGTRPLWPKWDRFRMNLPLLNWCNEGGGSKPGTKAGSALCKHLTSPTENAKPSTFRDIPLHTLAGQTVRDEKDPPGKLFRRSWYFSY